MKKFKDFEIKPLTLKEREICSNQGMSFGNHWTSVVIWVKYGLKILKGVDLTVLDEEERDAEINKLNEDEIADVSDVIMKATQNPSKKKSS